jgi:hypothetical protein
MAETTPPNHAEQVMEYILNAISQERRNQITEKGYDYSHDDEHTGGQLLNAAEAYLLNDRTLWPWSSGFHGVTAVADRPRQLVVAAALIAAEAERLRRAESAPDVALAQQLDAIRESERRALREGPL